MKVYISADIEGVCGIADWSEADKRSADYAEFRERMTADVAAACEAAVDAGATEVLVKDAHGSGRNIFAADLPAPARLIRGWSGHPLSMVQELDASFDAVLLLGYHSAAGSGGNPLAHTMSSAKVHELCINGEAVSEFVLHTWAAALFDVPVVFVSGDEELGARVRDLNPSIGVVAVMRGAGASSIALHPDEARELIRAGVREALSSDLTAIHTALPSRFAVSLRYKDHREAYRCSFYPGASLETADTVCFESNDWFEVLRALGFLI